MAITRIISMHINKGKTIAQCLKARVDYIENPEKTNSGELISFICLCHRKQQTRNFCYARNEYHSALPAGAFSNGTSLPISSASPFKPGESNARGSQSNRD